MADTARDRDYYDDFRPKERKGTLIGERKGQESRVREASSSMTSRVEAEAQVKYLKQQIELQTLLPDLNKNEFSRLTQKELFVTAFERSLIKFTEEEQKELKRILAPTSASMSRLSKAIGSGVRGLADDAEPAVLAKMLLGTLSGSGGKPANQSNLLLRFLASHHQQIRPLVYETQQTGRVPTLSPVGEWLHEEAVRLRNPSLGNNHYLRVAEKFDGATLKSNRVGDFADLFQTFQTKLAQLRIDPEEGKTRAKASDPVFTKIVSPHGQGALEGRVAQYKGSFSLETKGQALKTIDFYIPQLTTMDTSIRDLDPKTKTEFLQKHIGFTGRNLDVRRVFLPYRVMKERGNYTDWVDMTADEFYLKTVNEEILDPLLRGEMTARQAAKAFKKARKIFTDAELPGGSQHAISPVQENLEDFRSAAAIIVQPALPGTVDTETGAPVAHESLDPNSMSKFIEANAGKVGSDIAPGKMGQGVLSTIDLARMQMLPDTLIEHARQEQAIRRTTPAPEALHAAYQDHSPKKLTDALRNFDQQQTFIRRAFWKTTEETRKEAREMQLAQQRADRRREKKLGRPIRRKAAEGPKRVGAITPEELIKSGGLGFDESTVLETNKSGYKPEYVGMIDRLQRQGDRLTSLNKKIQKSGPFELTTGEYDELALISGRKNIPLWKLKELSNEAWKALPESRGTAKQKRRARKQNLSQRGLARAILEAPDKVSAGRLRRAMLSTATDLERDMFWGAGEQLPKHMGSPLGSFENIPDPKVRTRVGNIVKTVEEMIDFRKKGVIKAGNTLAQLRGEGYTDKELTLAYQNMVMRKDIAAIAELEGFTPVDIEAPKGSEAYQKLNKILSEKEGILHAGVYYVDQEAISDTTAVPWAKGGAFNSPSFREMSSYQTAGTLKLSYVNNKNLFSFSKDGTISLNQDFINERGGRGVFAGLDKNQKAPKYITGQMINSSEFVPLGINLVGTPGDEFIEMDYLQTHRPGELTKTMGDSKEGGVYASTQRQFDEQVKVVSNLIEDARGARILNQSRFQNDKMTFLEMFEKGKKPQLHNRQMLTALAGHQMIHMQSFAMEMLNRGRGEGAWSDKYIEELVGGDVRIQAPVKLDGTSASSLKGSWRSASSGLLLEDKFKFLTDLQEGIGNVTRPVDWDQAYDPGHKQGTTKLMEWYFKKGIALQNIIEPEQRPGFLADRARDWLHADYFGEIFGAVKKHFGAAAAAEIVSDVMKMQVKAGQNLTIGEALSERLAPKLLQALKGGKIKDPSTGKVMTPESYIQGRYTKAAGGGVVWGAARINWGDPVSQQGAGKMATMEPRMLDIMSSPTFGARGPQIAEDMLRRAAHYDISPTGEGKLAVHQETGEMLMSLAGHKKPGVGAEIYEPDLQQDTIAEIQTEIYKRGDRIVANRGGADQELFLKVGEDTIYIPPTDMKGMQRHTLEEGGRTFPAKAQIASHIEDFLHDVKDTSPREARGQLIENLGREWAIEGKGMGSARRTRIPGSQFKTAAKMPAGSKAVGAMDDLFVAKITRNRANQMFREMERTGFYEQKDIDQMRNTLLGTKDKKGGQIAGLVFRHPTIGPYSIQKIMFEITEGTDPTIYMPEKDVWIESDIFAELADNTNQGIRRTRIKLGPMVGMAADFDFDTLGAMFLAPEDEAVVRRELNSRLLPGTAANAPEQAYVKNYVEHQVRYQLLRELQDNKGTAASFKHFLDPTAQIAQQHIQQAQKLGVSLENIGKISSQLTMAKKAALSGMKGRDLYNIMTLAEWIEQKPIGFKHVNVETIKSRLAALTHGFESGTADGLREGIASFLDTDVKLLQDKVITLDEASRARLSKVAGVELDSELRGFDIDAMINKWAGAISRFDNSGEKVQTNAIRGKLGARALQKQMDLLSVETGIEIGGSFGRFVGNAEQVMSNLAGAAGKNMILDHKGIAALAAVGGLASLGSMTSQPREMVGPGKHLNANVKMNMNKRKAHKTITPNDVRPTRAPIGNPMGPNLLSQRRAMVASNPVPTDQFMVRARASHPDDVSLVSQQFQGFAVNAGYVSINNTSRSINNPYGEMNKNY